jgi:uncharacterized protein (DUF1501 family)
MSIENMSNEKMTPNSQSNLPDQVMTLVEKAGRHQLSRRELVAIAGAIGAGTLAASQLGPLRRALGISGASTAPGFGNVPSGSVPGGGNLLIVWLNGGNDGLNTLVPITGAEQAEYQKVRPSIYLTPQEVLKLGASAPQGLHPSFVNLQRRYLKGSVALVRGVGYQAPDLSHFESQGHWEHGYGPLGSAISQTATDGWLGRWANSAAAANPFRLISFRSDDKSMSGSNLEPLRLRPWSNNITGSNASDQIEASAIKGFNDLAGKTGLGSLADGLGNLTTRAITAGGSVGPAYADIPDSVSYIERQLIIAARLMNANLGVRVISANHGGFDTHSEQALRNDKNNPTYTYGWHGEVLRQLDVALETFFTTLLPATRANTTVLVYSEFGRRVEESGSFGTDHGTAGVSMVLGDQVNGGLFGDQPSLLKLDNDGNLIPTVDFRSIYATLISRFMGGDDSAILGASHQRLLLSKADATATTTTTTTTSTLVTTTTKPTTTVAPTTAAPTTAAPTTAAPTTAAATTVDPTTLAPTTAAPTTAAATTVDPTTLAPTTAAPTTVFVDTAPPTTAAATTAAPTTQAVTTAVATTALVTTMLAPTTIPPTSGATTTSSSTTTSTTMVIPVVAPPKPVTPMPGRPTGTDTEKPPAIVVFPTQPKTPEPEAKPAPTSTTVPPQAPVVPTGGEVAPVAPPTTAVAPAAPRKLGPPAPKTLALKPKKAKRTTKRKRVVASKRSAKK